MNYDARHFGACHTQHAHSATSFIRKHVFSLDHKVIGKQYYGLALVAVFVGMVLSWLMRIHLAWTNAAIPGLQLLSKNGAPGGVMTPGVLPAVDDHARHDHGLFCAYHGALRGFGNYFLPIQVGAEDMPFPRFNMMSFWVLLSLLVAVASFFVPDGPPLSGWTAYAPLSAVGAIAGPEKVRGRCCGQSRSPSSA